MISFEEYVEKCNVEERLKTARLGLLLAVNEKLKADERLLINLIIEQDLINETYTLNEESLLKAKLVKSLSLSFILMKNH